MRSPAPPRTAGVGAPGGWVPWKWLAGGLSVATVGAVLLPIAENWRETPKDSFPLSYYPMFALRRTQRSSVTYLVGIDARGGRTLLPYTLAGSGGLNQVRRQLNRAAREGWADELCGRVAARLAAKRQGPLAEVVEVRIVTGRYRLGQYFAGEQAPTSERVRASRPVPRSDA